MNRKLLSVILSSWTPRKLFNTGNGAWYDVSDLASLSQSSVSQVTVAVGDPIGKIIDKSGNNNHAVQVTSTARPILDAIAATTVGISYTTGLRLKHDFVDDGLTWTGATGSYWIAVCNISGVQFYQTDLVQTTGLIPISDMVGMVILNRAFTVAEQALLTKYFLSKLGSVPAANFLFECNSTSYIGRGGVCTGDFEWRFGKGVSYKTMFTSTETTTVREYLSFKCVPANLSQLICNINNLCGSLIDLSAYQNLNSITFASNRLTGGLPALTNIALEQAFFNTCRFTGYLPEITLLTALVSVSFSNNLFSGNIKSLSTNTALTRYICHTNALTGWDGGTIPVSLGDFQAQNNLLPQATIDALLAAFVAAGRNSGTRILNLGGTGNAAPSAAGLVSKAMLIARGWTVATN